MEGTELYPTPGTLSAEDPPPNPPGSPLSMTIVNDGASESESDSDLSDAEVDDELHSNGGCFRG